MRCIATTLLTYALLVLPTGSQAFGVLGKSPAAQSLSAASNTDITVTFDAPVDTSSINNQDFSVFGHWSGVAKGVFTFEDENRSIRFTPTTLFNAGEWVAVSLSRNVKSQAGDGLTHGYTWQFWVKPGPGSIELVEIKRIDVRETGEGHIQTYGAHGADLNEDGFSDFFVPNEITNDCRVFLNDGTGMYEDFTIYPITNGSRPSTNESADFNGDGHIDLAVGNSTNDQITVFLGDGLGGFLSIKNYQAATGVRGLAIADMDGDGFPDIATANRVGNNITTFHNNGDGTFAASFALDANATNETACATADANHDGILDLFVGAHGSGEVSLLLGDGEGGFTFSSKVGSGGSGPWMIAVGDINRDGHVDAAITNSQSSNVGVIFGDGAGGLSASVTYPTGGFPIAIDLGDIDGDEDLDLMTSNYSGGNWTYWENDGAGHFINRRSLEAETAGSCATFHDRDNDGDLDMTGIDEIDDLIIMFENPGTSAVAGSTEHSLNLLRSEPNPFNDRTTIAYTVPQGNHDKLILRIVDASGRTVFELLNGRPETGEHVLPFDANHLPAGTYVCVLELGTYREMLELIHVR